MFICQKSRFRKKQILADISSSSRWSCLCCLSRTRCSNWPVCPLRRCVTFWFPSLTLWKRDPAADVVLDLDKSLILYYAFWVPACAKIMNAVWWDVKFK